MKSVEILKEGLTKLHNQIQDRKAILKALQHLNRMDITELLNPAAETRNIFEALTKTSIKL